MDRLGRYRIKQEIGTGRYATVYEAQEGGDSYALKVFKDEAVPQDPASRAGLVRALSGLSKIAHPSAVRFVEAGQDEEKVFVATELMRCPTLATVLQEKQRLEEPKVVLFIRQAAQALDMARDAGLFHGDLNPSNVFVVSEERIRLSDFALKSFLEGPHEAPASVEAPAERDEDEWVTAEDLLEGAGGAANRERLEEDFVGLAGLMMSMFGVDVPPRETGESLEDYREGTMQAAYGEISDSDSGVGVHVAEVVRRLLAPGGFDSPGEVVVELAGAMLVRRTSSRASGSPTRTTPPRTATETAHATDEAEGEELALPAAGDLEPLAFSGDPREGAFTPFFTWSSRHGGRFFVVYDGEQLALGRDPDMADIVVMDPAISRRHCILSKAAGVIMLEDLGSTNGTFVNDERVHGTVEIGLGDNVRVGSTRLYMTLPSSGQQ
jgi:hypothetical protein